MEVAIISNHLLILTWFSINLLFLCLKQLIFNSCLVPNFVTVDLSKNTNPFSMQDVDTHVSLVYNLDFSMEAINPNPFFPCDLIYSFIILDLYGAQIK